jgi:hypothetical protein
VVETPSHRRVMGCLLLVLWASAGKLIGRSDNRWKESAEKNDLFEKRKTPTAEADGTLGTSDSKPVAPSPIAAADCEVAKLKAKQENQSSAVVRGGRFADGQLIVLARTALSWRR